MNEKHEVDFNVKVDLEDILIKISYGFDEDTIYDFITMLELNFSSYDLSERLYEYFCNVHKEYLESIAIEEARSRKFSCKMA